MIVEVPITLFLLFIFLIVSNFQVIDVNNIFVHVSVTSTKLSFTSIALAVVFIIRLFSTSTFRYQSMN